ncbi:MAG: penicillin-binding protein 2 [Rickettsiales bacterium]|nr:penicillin-binding protein 2 [Rickettsiales bacterium]
MPAEKAVIFSSSGRQIHSESRAKQRLEQTRGRLICAGFLFMLAFGAVAMRLVVVASTPLSASMLRQVNAETPNITQLTLADVIRQTTPNDDVEMPTLILPRRDIVDRNGDVLASSLETRSLYAHPQEIRQPKEAARVMAQVLPRVSQQKLLQLLSSSAKFVWLLRNLTPKEQVAVNELGIPGIYFQKEYTRVYPQGNLMSHILGFVNVDGQGLAGIEKSYNDQLKTELPESEPLQLTIDLRIQHLLDDQLQHAMKEFSAIGAAGLIADLKSGEVLALSSLPGFDPHHPGQSSQEALFNRVSLGTYEMGSTFKTFTAALALDSGELSMEDGFDTSHPIKVARYTITDTHPVYRWISIPEIYIYSSNIGTVKMIQKVGLNRQQAFMKKLGMFDRVSIELPERAEPLTPNPWHEINMMTISYGHGISVTPLHLAQGIQTMLNGGYRQGFTLLKGHNVPLEKSERIIKASTSDHVRRLMRAVVQYGTGKSADVAGYQVGGKTGTAEKVKAGGYAAKAKIASFVGAFPMNNPKYLMLVMVDEPQPTKKTYGYATGGWVAAPIIGRIVSQMGPLLGMKPNHDVAPDALDAYMLAIKEKEKRARQQAAQTRAVRTVSY